MFRAIFRYISAFCYLITGNVDEARRRLMKNDKAVAAQYDKIIQDKKEKFLTFANAVGRRQAEEDKRREQLKKLTVEVNDLRVKQTNAGKLAKKLVESYGDNQDGVKNNPEYITYQEKYKQFTAELKNKEQEAAELEAALKTIVAEIAKQKTQLSAKKKELAELQNEKSATIADILSAKEEKEIADLLAGVSEDESNRELEELREMRREAKATATVAREVSGAITSDDDAEFMAAARDSEAEDEFAKLVGLKKETGIPLPEGFVVPEAEKVQEKANVQQNVGEQAH